jgi:hypothetical protein
LKKRPCLSMKKYEMVIYGSRKRNRNDFLWWMHPLTRTGSMHKL